MLIELEFLFFQPHAGLLFDLCFMGKVPPTPVFDCNTCLLHSWAYCIDGGIDQIETRL